MVAISYVHILQQENFEGLNFWKFQMLNEHNQ